MPAVNNPRKLRNIEQPRIGASVNILGWGSQNDTDHWQPSERPKSLLATTIACPPHDVNNPFAALYADEHYPVFICIGAPSTLGGPCKGDAGGKHVSIRLPYLLVDEAP